MAGCVYLSRFRNTRDRYRYLNSVNNDGIPVFIEHQKHLMCTHHGCWNEPMTPISTSDARFPLLQGLVSQPAAVTVPGSGLSDPTIGRRLPEAAPTSGWNSREGRLDSREGWLDSREGRLDSREGVAGLQGGVA